MVRAIKRILITATFSGGVFTCFINLVTVVIPRPITVEADAERRRWLLLVGLLLIVFLRPAVVAESRLININK
jgi:hypothetical protein